MSCVYGHPIEEKPDAWFGETKGDERRRQRRRERRISLDGRITNVLVSRTSSEDEGKAMAEIPASSTPGLLFCGKDDDEYGNLLQMIMRAVIVIVVSHVLHLFLHRLGQPSAIAQILAGIVVGPSVLGHIKYWRENIFDPDKAHLFGAGMMIGRMILMFLIGIEMDIEFLWRSASRATAVAAGGAFASVALAAVLTNFVHSDLSSTGNMFLSGVALALLFANTATPVVVRIAAELKLAHSEVGQLAISSALVNDMSCLLVLALMAIVAADQKSGQKPHQRAAGTAVMILMLAAAVGVMRLVIGRMNRRYLRRRHLGNWHGVAILVFVLAISCLTEMMGYSNMMVCFILGLFFPRDGGAARTMVDWLTPPVNNIILPIYFAYAGFQTDLTELKDTKVLMAVAAVVGLSTVAKVAGTVMVTGLMDIPTHEGLVLGFLLNVKGHVHLIVLNVANKIQVWNYRAFSALLVTLAVNTLIAGPVAAAIVGIRRRALKYRAVGLQHLQLKSELRMLTCVHSPRDMPTMLTLIEMSSGMAVGAPITAFMLYLVELTQRVTTTMLYHQKEDDDEDDDDGGDDGDNDARRVHLATDAFRRQSGLKVRLVTAISGFASMHEDVCNAAEDVKAAVVVMPFHKHQRIDGKMQAGKEAERGVNERVLRYAPCTVGILVDRGMDGVVAGQTPASAVAASEQELRRVVVLFFGGEDDREALSLGGRLAMHPCVSLTVVRFLLSESRRGADSSVGMEVRETGDDHIRVAMPDRDGRRGEDDVFLAKFQERFVGTGMVTYMEEFVSDGAETVAVLSSMVGSFSLFIVGKGREGSSPLTVGMNDWEECPELGVIGDLLASSDFMTHGSVLVLQQHRTKQDDISSEFM